MRNRGQFDRTSLKIFRAIAGISSSRDHLIVDAPSSKPRLDTHKRRTSEKNEVGMTLYGKRIIHLKDALLPGT